MKKLLLFALLALPFAVQAQDWSGEVYKVGRIYPGFYITNTNDTIEGYFKHGDQVDNQKRCSYYQNETDKKPTQVFKPEDIKGYKVGDKMYHSIHFSGGLVAKPLRFNLVTKEGAITQYTFYDENPIQTTAEPKSQMVFLKVNEANAKVMMLQDFGLGFAKKMSAFVSDNEDLSKKVADKEKGYGMLDIQTIIDEYNAWYAQNHQ